MFWYYYLIDQTIRKNHETYDDRGVQQNFNSENQPQDYNVQDLTGVIGCVLFQI